MNTRIPVYVALDVDDTSTALHLAKVTSPYVMGFKVGPRLALGNDKCFLLKLKSYGKLFLDFKFFDIPSTMVSSVKAVFDLGADLVTVHAASGRESLLRLAELERDYQSFRPGFKILAVTILTSFQQNNLPYHQKIYSVFSQVEDLSRLAVKCGIGGLVCSGQEITALRKRFPKVWILTPGIRWENTPSHDQKRTVSPLQAIQNGASALVMGRDIIQSANPIRLCERLYNQLSPLIKS